VAQVRTTDPAYSAQADATNTELLGGCDGHRNPIYSTPPEGQVMVNRQTGSWPRRRFDRKSSFQLVDYSDGIPISYASRNGRADLVHLQLTANADVNAPTRPK